MKNTLCFSFLFVCLTATAQTFGISVEAGASAGLYKFIHPSHASPDFHQLVVPGPSLGIVLNLYPEKENAGSYYSFYVASYGKSATVVVKTAGERLAKTNSDGSLNAGVRWNYHGKHTAPYCRGIMLGVNITHQQNRDYTRPKDAGATSNSQSARVLTLDRVVTTGGIAPSLQLGIYKGIILTNHTCLRFALLANIGFNTTSWRYYQANIGQSRYTAVQKSKGDLLHFSVAYGYWHAEKRS